MIDTCQYSSQSRAPFAGERRFSKSRGLSASVSFAPLPHPPSFLFLLSPHFSRGRNAENPVFRSFLHGNACYAGYEPDGDLDWSVLVGSGNLALTRMSLMFLRTFTRKFFNIDFFLKILPLKDNELVMSEMSKKWGVTDFVLERTCTEEHLNLSKSGFVSEEGHSGCKSQNITIRALKGNVLCQIWFKWTY